MAKEKFVRDKPHVNIGTVSEVLQDTSGQLTLDGMGSETTGNPAPSTLLMFSTPGQSTPQVATVGYPFDDEFVFDPGLHGPAMAIDFAVDVLPAVVEGTPQLHVTLAILQDEAFVATAAGGSTGSGVAWLSFLDSPSATSLLARDFLAVDGGGEHPDFSRPFQFGYAFTGEYSADGLNVEVGVDNMVVEITTVPEPSSLVLVAAMGVALVVGRWLLGKDDAK